MISHDELERLKTMLGQMIRDSVCVGVVVTAPNGQGLGFARQDGEYASAVLNMDKLAQTVIDYFAKPRPVLVCATPAEYEELCQLFDDADASVRLGLLSDVGTPAEFFEQLVGETVPDAAPTPSTYRRGELNSDGSPVDERCSDEEYAAFKRYMFEDDPDTAPTPSKTSDTLAKWIGGELHQQWLMRDEEAHKAALERFEKGPPYTDEPAKLNLTPYDPDTPAQIVAAPTTPLGRGPLWPNAVQCVMPDGSKNNYPSQASADENYMADVQKIYAKYEARAQGKWLTAWDALCSIAIDAHVMDGDVKLTMTIEQATKLARIVAADAHQQWRANIRNLSIGDGKDYWDNEPPKE